MDLEAAQVVVREREEREKRGKGEKAKKAASEHWKIMEDITEVYAEVISSPAKN